MDVPVTRSKGSHVVFSGAAERVGITCSGVLTAARNFICLELDRLLTSHEPPSSDRNSYLIFSPLFFPLSPLCPSFPSPRPSLPFRHASKSPSDLVIALRAGFSPKPLGEASPLAPGQLSVLAALSRSSASLLPPLSSL